jgi:hypothetical protein
MREEERQLMYDFWDKEERLRNALALQARKMKEFYASPEQIEQATSEIKRRIQTPPSMLRITVLQDAGIV